MPLEVHREPFNRRYYAPFCSLTCLYIVIFFFILIFLPLIIAYNSYNFWWKQAYVLEQPQIKYQYFAIMQWSGFNSDTSETINFYFSTNPLVNQLYSVSMRAPLFRSAEVDTNRDGLNERLEISAQLPLQSNEKITSMTTLLFFNVQLNSIAKYVFDSVGFINYESGSPIADLQIDGDLLVRQTWPLSTYGGYKLLYSDSPLLPDLSWGLSAEQVAINKIMGQNTARNVTTVFRPTYQYVTQRGSALTDPAVGESLRSYCNTSIVIQYPQQPISYTPPLSAVLKFAWVQYMSFFIVVAFLLYSLNSFIFTHQLLPVYAASDIVESSTHQKKL